MILSATTAQCGGVLAPSSETPSPPMDAQVLASLSFSGGGLGLASAHRVRTAAHFASWADSLNMVRKRHHHIAATMIRNLEVVTSRSFQFVRDCKDVVVDAGLDVPSLKDLSVAASSGGGRVGAQRTQVWVATTGVKADGEKFVSDHLWPSFDNAQRALMRSQCGPLASAALTALLTFQGHQD